MYQPRFIKNPNLRRQYVESVRGFPPLTRNRTRKRRGALVPTQGGTDVRTTLLQQVPIFPISKAVDGMVYYDYLKTLTGSPSAVPTHAYSANGMYDPDSSGLGHQPMGFDNLMAFYEQTTVVKSHISVTFYAAAGTPARVGIYLSPDTSVQTLPGLVENGLMKMTTVGGSGTGNGKHAFATLELTCDVPTYFGKTRGAILADPQMYTTIAANPGEQVYFNVCAWSPFDGAADVAIGYDVIITYDTVFWEPKKLSPS